MIGKIQNNFTFKGVYIRRNGQAEKNIKQTYARLLTPKNTDSEVSIVNFTKTNFNAILKYGMEQLNDKKIDDGETRFLTFNTIYDRKTNQPAGYNLGITDEKGNEFSKATSYSPGASIVALKNAFDELKENYKKDLTEYAIKKHEDTCSSVGCVIAEYAKEDGPANV